MKMANLLLVILCFVSTNCLAMISEQVGLEDTWPRKNDKLNHSSKALFSAIKKIHFGKINSLINNGADLSAYRNKLTPAQYAEKLGYPADWVKALGNLEEWRKADKKTLEDSFLQKRYEIFLARSAASGVIRPEKHTHRTSDFNVPAAQQKADD